MNEQRRNNSKKNFSRRQFLAMAGTLTAGTVLAACTPTAPGAQQAGEVAPGEEVVELIAWFTDRRSINQMTEEEAKPDFESQNPGITVNVQFVPESEIQQKLLTSNAAGNAPDLSSIDETFLDTLTKENVLLPIPEEVINVKEEMGLLTSGLYRLPQGAPDGEFYGLPNGVFCNQLYYNATLLDELGYTPEDIPNTWSEFLQWAEDITVWDGDNLELTGMAFYGNEGAIQGDRRFQSAGPLDGNVYATKDSTRHSDEVGIQSWEFVMDLYNTHKLDSQVEGVNSRDRFGSGRAVTLYQHTWFNGLMDTQYTDVDWGLVIPPTISGEPVYGNRGPDVGFTLTTQNDAHLEPVSKFYRYLLSPAYMSKYCKLRGVQPSLKEMWDDPDFSADAGPRWAAIAVKNRPENSVDQGFSPRELGDIGGRVLPAIRDEGEDIATVLQQVEEASNEFLQTNPQWSILSAADYEANPEWLTAAG